MNNTQATRLYNLYPEHALNPAYCGVPTLSYGDDPPICLRVWHAANITRTPWTVTPSLPIPDTTYPKKEPMSPPRIRYCRLPHSPKHPGPDAGEDPHHQKPHEITVEHAHKALLPTRDEPEHDAPIAPVDRSISLRHLYELLSILTASTLLWGGPRATAHWPQSGHHPVHLFPFPTLVVSCPPPFKFTKRAIVFCFFHYILCQAVEDSLSDDCQYFWNAYRTNASDTEGLRKKSKRRNEDWWRHDNSMGQ
jgi:hypothetical protein